MTWAIFGKNDNSQSKRLWKVKNRKNLLKPEISKSCTRDTCEMFLIQFISKFNKEPINTNFILLIV